MLGLAADFGVATPVCPVSSEFEMSNFRSIVDGKTHIRFLSWPRDADGLLTFSQLVKVVCLDMRCIGLTYLPQDVGLCVNLECLDVRDNYLQYLPPELSQCARLRTLLYSGNSLPYKSQIQALIELRQLNQAVGNCPHLRWSFPNAQFTVISWNVIAQHESTQQNFPRCPGRYLRWDYRAELFTHTILNMKPHLVCIQDVEEAQLEPLVDRMKTIGYGCAASFASRPLRPGLPIVGVATFYLKARLVVEKTITVAFSDLPANQHVTKLQLLANEAAFQVSVVRMQTQSIFLINAALLPSRFEPDVLLAQMHIIAERLDGLTGQAVICGSFGFLPGSPAYQLMTTGQDPTGKFKLRRSWRSVYADASIPLDFTHWQDDELTIRDYIWISPLLAPSGHVMVPTKEEALQYHHTAPNAQWPSNHIPIGVALDVKSTPQEVF
jgi:hypothetical protein